MIDIKKLKEIYQFTKGFSFTDIRDLVKASKRKKFKKKDILININSTSNEVFMVLKGMVRCFRIDENGEDITIALYPENYLVPNVDYVLCKDKSRSFYEAIEETVTLSMDLDAAMVIIERSNNLAVNSKFIYLKFMKRMYQRIQSFVLLSPEKRYELFVKENPSINTRVPDKYIANILGITPVSLSRIRKRLSKNN